MSRAPTKSPVVKLAYDAKEASQHLPFGEARVYKLLKAGELRSFRMGTKWVVSHKEIERWLEARTEQASLERDALHAKYEFVE